MHASRLTEAQEIIAGLQRTPASISPKYFYDPLGSALFERITRLPEYYPTRTERDIMAAHGDDMARKIGVCTSIIELGAGSCEKARRLCELVKPSHFVAVDISAEFLLQAVEQLRAVLPHVSVWPVAADLTDEITLPTSLPMQHRLVFYPGSSIGNFDEPQALDLLTRARRMIDTDAGLLIGVDLVKELSVLHAAYNDAAGVTQAFNLNLLAHVNRVIGSDFDTNQWSHQAFFNVAQSRIEMHLEAVVDVVLRWPGGSRRFAQGERIHTENSYKYRVEDFVALLRRAGFNKTDVWCDERQWFAVVLARP